MSQSMPGKAANQRHLSGACVQQATTAPITAITPTSATSAASVRKGQRTETRG